MLPLRKRTFFNRSLERALQILCTFNTDRQTLSLTQLAKMLNLSKTTNLRLNSTLIKYDFLKYDPSSKQYFLGLKLFELGSVVFLSFSIRRAASPYLSQLQSKLNKTVFLGILQEDELIYIDKKEDPRNPIQFSSQIGTRCPPYFGMLGQILMAFLPDSEVDGLLVRNPLKTFTKRSLTNENGFKKRLHKIREEGFFVDKEEALDGVTGIAAPIRDFTGKVIAGLGVGCISSSLDTAEIKKIIKDVCQTAKKISQDMGYIEREAQVRP